jgi:hypothetical protein
VTDRRRSLAGLLVPAAIFAVAMAYVESAVVVYLRALYYPQGPLFPMAPQLGPHLPIEVGREAATLVMLAAVGWGAGRCWRTRSALFIFLFGIWDIFYYFWLWAFIGWPSSLLTWDILFLIPVAWTSPVIAPLSVAAAMCLISAVWLHWLVAGRSIRFRAIEFALGTVGAVTFFSSFVYNFRFIERGGVPTSFPWSLLLLGHLCWVAMVLRTRPVPTPRPAC